MSTILNNVGSQKHFGTNILLTSENESQTQVTTYIWHLN